MIIFDLEGCLADCEHRKHFLQKPWDECHNCYCMITHVNQHPEQGKCGICGRNPFTWEEDWKSFNESCDKDLPNYSLRRLLWRFDPYTSKIGIWTGRCESVREKTAECLSECMFLGNFITVNQIDLRMRPIGDDTPEYKLKEGWYDLHNVDHPNDNIEFVFSADPESIAMWKRRGVFVLDCRQGE